MAAMEEMFSKQEPIDVVTLQQRLRDKGQLEGIGGIAYLASLQDATPSAANVSYYIEILREKYAMRRLVQSCTEIVGDVYENGAAVPELLDRAQVSVLKVGQIMSGQTEVDSKQLVLDAMGDIEISVQRGGQIVGVSTGFTDLDRMTGGFNPGEMIVIAARPSMGKTSLALNIADHVAVTLKLPVGVFSLEMTARSLMQRMICSRARVNLRNIREGFLAERDLPRLAAASGQLASAPLFIDETCGLSILQLRAKAMRIYQKHGIKLFVIDYLQLLNSTNKKVKDRQQEVADISAGVKMLAKELKVPVIVLSQLNRDMERDRKKKPKLSDLRESGAIEQDADTVGLLYKPSSGDDEENGHEEQDAAAMGLFIAKQRSGPTGTVALTFLRSYTRFESAAKVCADDVPEDELPSHTARSWQDRD